MIFNGYFYFLIKKLLNNKWTNETSNMTYIDGSTSFQIVFDSSGRKEIEASIPFTPIKAKDYVDIRYGYIFNLINYLISLKKI